MCDSQCMNTKVPQKTQRNPITFRLLTASKASVLSMHRLPSAALPWGWSLTATLCWKRRIQHSLVQTCQEEKVWTVSASLQFLLSLTLHIHLARISSHGLQDSGRSNFNLRWATGGSYFIILFPPPWWIQSPHGKPQRKTHSQILLHLPQTFTQWFS